MTKVLVAEDSCAMRKIILRTLRAIGIPDGETVQAKDGAEAVDLFGKGHFDLVLTDWNMPAKSGLEVTQEIRKQDATVPIIMITTESDEACVVAAIQAGVSDYLVKPFDTDSLRAKVEKWRA